MLQNMTHHEEAEANRLYMAHYKNDPEILFHHRSEEVQDEYRKVARVRIARQTKH